MDEIPDHIIKVVNSYNFAKIDEYLDSLAEDKQDIYTKVTHIKINSYMKELDKADRLADKLLKEIDRSTKPLEYLYVLHAKAWVYYYRGLYKKGFEATAENLPAVNMIIASTQSKEFITMAMDYLLIHGRMAINNGKFIDGSQAFAKAIEYAEQTRDEYRLQEALGSIGLMYFRQGNNVKSMELLNEAYNIAERIDAKRSQRMWLTYIGTSLIWQGKLNSALQLQIRALELSEQLGDKAGIVNCYFNLSEIFLRKGNITEALSYLDILSFDEIQNDDSYAYFTYKKLLMQLELKNKRKSSQLLLELKQIAHRNSEKRIEIISKLGQAAYLKNQYTFREKAEAESIFRSIIESEDQTLDIRFFMDAFVYLAEILLEQLRLLQLDNLSFNPQDEENAMLEEIRNIAKQILALGANQNSFILEVEASYMLAHLALADLDMKAAQNYFRRAFKISEENDIKHTNINQPEFEQANEIELVNQIAERDVFPYAFQKSVNSIIHSLPRLGIIVYLLNNGISQFTELQADLNLSSGNLTRHCDKLIESGYVHKGKEFIDGRPITTFQLTPTGVSEFQNYSRLIKSYL